jgi:hypothetical protein
MANSIRICRHKPSNLYTGKVCTGCRSWIGPKPGLSTINQESRRHLAGIARKVAMNRNVLFQETRRALPDCDGISHADRAFREALGQILHGSAKTTHAVRTAIQRSKASIKELAGRADLNPKTMTKWRKRAFVHDGAEGTAFDGAQRRGGGPRRCVPQAHAVAARRLSLCSPGDHPTFDVVIAASLVQEGVYPLTGTPLTTPSNRQPANKGRFAGPVYLQLIAYHIWI